MVPLREWEAYTVWKFLFFGCLTPFLFFSLLSSRIGKLTGFFFSDSVLDNNYIEVKAPKTTEDGLASEVTDFDTTMQPNSAPFL
jgi:hypothetical protein